MGGGDLNLKKSWHPSTLRNIERVWKAEQKHEAEQKKIEQLQRELAEERAKEEMQNYAENQGVVKKKEEKLDWMYQGPAALVDREQYLTGRQIDKTFEILEQQEQGNLEPVSENDRHIGSLFNQSSSTAPVDIANKIREDPLFMIRKQEEEKQKKLFNNPIKLKQLQEMLKNSLSSSKDKKKKKRKHKRKHDDSDDEDCEIVKRKRHSSKDRTLKSKMHRKSGGKVEKRRRRDRQTDSDSSDDDRNNRKYNEMKYDRRDIRSGRQNGSYKSQSSESYSKKMSKEEMDRKRQEMMENAVWREKQRNTNILNYKEDEMKESALSEKIKSKDFIKPMLSKAADCGTVEARIKQNIYNIQRNSGSMDRNFARR